MFAINCYSMIISRPTCIIFSVFKICSFLSHPKICVYEKRVLYKYWYSWFFTSTITWVWLVRFRIWNKIVGSAECIVPLFSQANLSAKASQLSISFQHSPLILDIYFPDYEIIATWRKWRDGPIKTFVAEWTMGLSGKKCLTENITMTSVSIISGTNIMISCIRSHNRGCEMGCWLHQN